jgi:Flp pilus assembly protein TadD
MAPAGQLDVCLADAREALAADRLGDAVSQAAAAVALAPGDAEARSLLARALLRTGREVEGEEELRQALAIDPRHPAALMEQARLCAKRGELTRAIDSWQRLLTLSPDSPFAEQARQGVAHARELATVLEAVDA